MSQIIDADTHIAESPTMWNLIHPSLYSRRPVMVSAPERYPLPRFQRALAH